jgi:MSHA biogenesis protein MshN
MSIVNQMLKDLDARCGPASDNQLAALHGLGLVASGHRLVPNPIIFLAWGCASLFAVFVGYYTISWWHGRHQPIDTQFVQTLSETAVPAAATHTAHVRPVKPEKPEPIQMERTISGSAVDKTETQITAALAIPPQPIAARESVREEAPPPPKPVKKLTAQQKADRLFADAQNSLAEQDYATSEVLLRQALFEFPRHHTARAQLAALLTARQNTDAAERILSQGLQGNGQEVELAKPYAQLLVARGELDPALAVLNTAIAGGRADSETYALRAAVLQRLDHHAAAIQDYRHALKAQPQNAVWWAGLAIAEEHDQQLQSALAAYRQAARLPMEDSLRNYVNQRIQLIQLTDGQ